MEYICIELRDTEIEIGKTNEKERCGELKQELGSHRTEGTDIWEREDPRSRNGEDDPGEWGEYNANEAQNEEAI